MEFTSIYHCEDCDASGAATHDYAGATVAQRKLRNTALKHANATQHEVRLGFVGRLPEWVEGGGLECVRCGDYVPPRDAREEEQLIRQHCNEYAAEQCSSCLAASDRDVDVDPIDNYGDDRECR